MINLLPDHRKEDIRAARANTIILRYTGIIILALAFLGGALYLSYSLLQTTMQANEEVISSNDIKAGIYDDTRQQVAHLSEQLTETKAILDQEVRFSKILMQLGQLMPPDTVMSELTLTTASLAGTPIDVVVYAKSISSASTLQAQFQRSTLFSQVSLSGTEDSGGIEEYPAKITLSLTLNRQGLQR